MTEPTENLTPPVMPLVNSPGGRVIMVSNRLLSTSNSASERKAEAGGLTVVAGEPLRLAAQEGTKVVWYGSATTDYEREVARAGGAIPDDPERPNESIELVPLDIDPQTYQQYYGEYANRMFWMPDHGFPHELSDAEAMRASRAYSAVNKQFAERLLVDVEDGDTIWLNDYHFSEVGQILVEALQEQNVQRTQRGEPAREVNIVGYWHVPHATVDVIKEQWPEELAERRFSAMPYVRWGFHSERWADNYAACVVEFGDRNAVNMLVGGLDKAARERLLSKLDPSGVSRLVGDLNHVNAKTFARDLKAIRLDNRVAGVEVAPQIVQATTELRTRLISRSAAQSEQITRSTGLFVAPGTMNPEGLNALGVAAQSRVEELEAQLTEMNGGVPFDGPRFGFVGRFDPKNGLDVLEEAIEELGDEGPVALMVAGVQARKGLEPYDRHFAAVQSRKARLEAHPNVHLIWLSGEDRANATAIQRMTNAVQPAAAGGRDLVGAEPGGVWQPGDRPNVPVISAAAAISETTDGYNAANSAFDGGPSGKAAEIVPGLEATRPFRQRVRNLATALRVVRDLPEQERESRSAAYRAAVHAENGPAWFHRVFAEAHGSRVLQEGLLPRARHQEFARDLERRLEVLVSDGHAPSREARRLLSAHDRPTPAPRSPGVTFRL